MFGKQKSIVTFTVVVQVPRTGPAIFQVRVWGLCYGSYNLVTSSSGSCVGEVQGLVVETGGSQVDQIA